MIWEKAPDPNWVPIIREFTVALCIFSIVILAGVIALGKSTKENGYGLIETIGVLSTLTGVLMGKK